MNWHDLDLAVLTLFVASLLGRKYIYFYAPSVHNDAIVDSINKRTTITILVIVANLLALLTEAAGLISTRNFWIVMAASGAPAIVCLPFFIGQEITLIKGKRSTTLQ